MFLDHKYYSYLQIPFHIQSDKFQDHKKCNSVILFLSDMFQVHTFCNLKRRQHPMLVDRFLASIECTLLMKSSLILTDKCLDYINYSFQSLSHFGKFQLNTVNRDLLT